MWRQDHLSMSLACPILAQQVLGYRSQMKRQIHSDTYGNTFMFAVSNWCESIPQGYFITGYNTGTTAAELKKYSKCFVNLTDRTLLAIQLQRDGNAMTTRCTQTSQWMWPIEKICTMHCFSTLNVWCGFDRASSLICGNKMPTRCSRWFLLQILLLAQHVSGIIMPIIRSSIVLYKWLLPVVFGALAFKLLVWYNGA